MKVEKNGVSSKGKKYRTTTYKGHKLLVLGDPDSRFPVQFGVKKAHMILKNMEAVKAFCEDNPLEDEDEE